MRTAQECIERAEELLAKLEETSPIQRGYYIYNEPNRIVWSSNRVQAYGTLAQANIDLARYLREEVMYHPLIGLETIGKPDSIQAAPKPKSL